MTSQDKGFGKWLGCEGVVLANAINAHAKEHWSPSSPLPLLACEDAVRRWPLMKQETAFTKHQLGCCLKLPKEISFSCFNVNSQRWFFQKPKHQGLILYRYCLFILLSMIVEILMGLVTMEVMVMAVIIMVMMTMMIYKVLIYWRYIKSLFILWPPVKTTI